MSRKLGTHKRMVATRPTEMRFRTSRDATILLAAGVHEGWDQQAVSQLDVFIEIAAFSNFGQRSGDIGRNHPSISRQTEVFDFVGMYFQPNCILFSFQIRSHLFLDLLIEEQMKRISELH